MKVYEIIYEAKSYDIMFPNNFIKIYMQLNPSFNLKEILKYVKRIFKKENKIIWFIYKLKMKMVKDILSNIDNYKNIEHIIKKEILKYNKAFNVNLTYDNIKISDDFNFDVRDILSKFQHYYSMNVPDIDNYIMQKTDSIQEVLTKFQEAEDKYISNLQQRTISTDKQNPDVFLEINDKWKWFDLGKNSCDIESRSMGHCGNVGSMNKNETILSLREKISNTEWVPHLTFIYDRKNKVLGEMKGYKNNKPSKRFHKYIMPLILDDRIKGLLGGGYKPENNFQLEDLSDKERNLVLSRKPKINEVKIVDFNGIEKWYKNGKLHRTDGPAVIHPDGAEEWYKNGKLHRTDGPAMVHHDGKEVWYQNGKLHREDGPAVIHPDGAEEWFKNNRRHRDDGPAIVHPNGTKEWYRNDKLHRTDGPAVIYSDGKEQWWINGERIK